MSVLSWRQYSTDALDWVPESATLCKGTDTSCGKRRTLPPKYARRTTISHEVSSPFPSPFLTLAPRRHDVRVARTGLHDPGTALVGIVG